MDEAQFRELIRRHPEARQYMQYVPPGKDGRRGYWRVTPYTYFEPKEANMRLRREFALTAIRSFGKRGFRQYKGKITPVVAAEVGKQLSGRRFTDRDEYQRQAMAKIIRLLELQRRKKIQLQIA